MKSKTSKRHREKVQSDPMYGCRECPDFKADRLKHILHNGRANMSLQRHVMQNHPECAEKWKDFRIDAERRPRANRKTASGARGKARKTGANTVQNGVRNDEGEQATHGGATGFAQDPFLAQNSIFEPMSSDASPMGAKQPLSYLSQTRLWQETSTLPYAGTAGWVQDTSYDMNTNAQPLMDDSSRTRDLATSSGCSERAEEHQISVYPDL